MLTLELELKNKNINPTAMRLLVLKFLKKQSTAVTLNDIENSFEQSDRVTIYRTIKTFEAKGLIHSITSNNVTQYALCKDACNEINHQDTHVHFQCRDCNAIICLPSISIPKIELPKNFSLDELEIIARGICDQCQD
ncbi:Fur family transcriptional regulator [Myroides sp. LJL115]